MEIVGFLGFVPWISGVFASDDDDDDDDDDSLASWSFRFGCSNNFLLLGGCLLQEILALILDPRKHDSGTTLDNSLACWPAPKTRSFLCFLSFFVFLVLSL